MSSWLEPVCSAFRLPSRTRDLSPRHPGTAGIPDAELARVPTATWLGLFRVLIPEHNLLADGPLYGVLERNRDVVGRANIHHPRL